MTEIITDLPLDSKVWVYQNDRPFNNEEIEQITSTLQSFVSSWDSHGSPLRADFKIAYKQFILIFVDENIAGASGCSIDRSVKIIRKLENDFDLSLLNNSLVAYKNDTEIKIIPHNTVKSTIDSGEISKDTIIFNNTVTSVADLQENWQQAAKNSWCSRFFK